MKGEEYLHGIKVETVNQKGEVSGIMQTCSTCGNDNFMVIFTKFEENDIVGFLCGKCDKEQMFINVNENRLYKHVLQDKKKEQ